MKKLQVNLLFLFKFVPNNLSVTKDLIGENEGRKLIKNGDYEDMANSIIKYLTNDADYSASSNFILKRSENFSSSFVAERYEEIFLKSISSGD